MAVSYKRFWKILIDKDLKKKALAEKASLSTYTINKLNREKIINTNTLEKIYTTLHYIFDEIGSCFKRNIVNSAERTEILIEYI